MFFTTPPTLKQRTDARRQPLRLVEEAILLGEPFHAINDGLLGAAAMGDIGEMFPDTDPANKGRDSADMLHRAWAKVTAAGWRIVNLDCVVFAQRPKILPHRAAIRRRITEILRIEEEAVWLKAKTGEGVGPIGEELAVAAECVVLIERGT